MDLGQEHKNVVSDDVMKDIVRSLNSLKYGYLQITVHDSKVVQIDKTERTRFSDSWRVAKGGASESRI